jgi:hypothetical protein
VGWKATLLVAKRSVTEREKVWCVEKERRQCVGAGSGGDGNDCQERDEEDRDGDLGLVRVAAALVKMRRNGGNSDG